MYTDDMIVTNKKNRKTYPSSNNNTLLIIVIFIIIGAIVYIYLNNKSDKKNSSFVLVGNDVTIKYKEKYIEPGYKYIDENNNDLSDKVQVVNNINNKVPGTYKVIYRYDDQILTRKVTVLKPDSYDVVINYTINNTDLTNESIIVNYSIIGDTFYKVELPNGNVSNEVNGSFTIDKNGTYLIKAYNELYQLFEKEITINNIIREKPTGTCVLNLLDAGGEIIITPNNESILKGYQYNYGNNKSELTTDKKYAFNTMDENASVIIFDKAGNNNTITCNNIDKSSKQQSSYKKESFQSSSIKFYYTFYKPSVSIREKVPLVIYFHGAGGLDFALPKNLSSGKQFPYYVINPINFYSSNAASLIELINDLASKYNIDKKRIVISGGSAGSPTALKIASKYQIFSGIIIIAGYNQTPNVDANGVTYLPVWFLQGSYDNFKEMSNYVDKINQVGGNAKITSIKGYHDAPNDAFLREDVTEWILNNKAK